VNSILHTPWSDEITLIWVESGQAASGFENRMEHRSTPPLMCDWEDGVSQSEFYQSMKAGMAATAQAEVNTADYLDFWPAGFTGIRYAEFKGKRYRIIRSFPQTFDSLTLILEEAIR
jgi:hypothetical protein